MTPYQLETEISRSAATVTGTVEQFSFATTEDGCYTIESRGSADILLEVYGPFADVPTTQPTGKPRMCLRGIGRWACDDLPSGNYLVLVTQNTPGSFVWKIRSWRFGDKALVEIWGS